MNPEQLPLEPLIAPPPVSWWPLAPFWWVVVAMVIISILLMVLLYGRKKQPKQPTLPKIDVDIRRQAAIAELANMTRPYDQAAGIWLQQVNNLLKRICNIRYPQENAKILMGQDWLSFLDSKCPTAQLTKFPVLIDGEYRNNYHLNKVIIDSLYVALEEWIAHHV